MRETTTTPKPIRPHRLTIDERNRAVVSGVEDVLNFNEQAVMLLTSSGALTLAGEGLHVSLINLEEGQLIIDGAITAMEYDDRHARGRGSMFARLFK